MKSKTVAVLGFVKHDRVTLVDRRGRTIVGNVPREAITGPVNSVVSESILWKVAVARMSRSSGDYKAKDPWSTKAASLAKSFYLRSRDLARPRSHYRRPPPATWKDASKWLRIQARNHFLNQSQSPWSRWADTVSRNHNRKSKARYAKETANRHSISNHEPGRGAKLPLCA